MKSIKYIFIFILFSCNVPEQDYKAKTVIKSPQKPRKNEIEGEKKQQSKSFQKFGFYEIERDKISTPSIKNSTSIIFESNFESDTVKLLTDSKIILNKSITTDHRIGVANVSSFDFSKIKLVKFQFKNHPIQSLDSLEYYSYLFVSRKINSEVTNLYFSNEERMYK